MKLALIFFLVAIAGLQCNKVLAGDNTINIEQVGDNNTITISQDGSGHTATVELGKTTAGSGNNIAIDQKDSGPKVATVIIPTGINNGVSILQQGAGNHTANIQNLNGSGNNISIDQNGAGNHQFILVGTNGSTNNGNTVGAVQSGGFGADKSFQLDLNGANGATVGIQQTNPTQANQGTMTIQCNPCTGNYSYTRF